MNTSGPTVSRPTVVLVHGEFSDATCWFGVIAELHRRDVAVVAAANPLRGLAHDAEYLVSLLSGIDGPVVLVGHSYGGALITDVGSAANVLGLVYVAAYLPDVGESFEKIGKLFAPSPIRAHLRRSSVAAPDTDRVTELTIRRDAFPALFAGDLDPELAGVLATVQRPITERTLTEAVSTAAWRTKPSWALVTGADQTLLPEIQRFTAQRAGAVTVEAPGASHAVTVSRPSMVAELILEVTRTPSSG
ncbi:alpha/beta fold hydrolase [Streptacidiphilus fuscans]|uniref:Alpha/beta hydrolase n=1 Tax=Streptacidiphilus fuscans TaxID=2789292 RepID=A0A931AX32_9ACTN|nr:alpha/beta hydrolase [Streptacidiphilus fuscans]MBF9066459.1 alpha/beta hydrolase [Streptacidiphilus fuscans]